MEVRIAQQEDCELIARYDRHIAKKELDALIMQERVLIAEEGSDFIGWLRWNLFWDNTPFMNMLYLLEAYRGQGYGKVIVMFWEKLMKEQGYGLVITSTLSDENAQHFYRKLKYVDSGSLILKNEPLEIIFAKEI